tara:strand:+ start:168 stop:386 length:219 start_codon:yes stop_codon:yes gene_type:complete
MGFKKQLLEVEVGQKFQYVGKKNDYFTKGKTYFVKNVEYDFAKIETEVVFIDDDMSDHFAPQNYLTKNFKKQ